MFLNANLSLDLDIEYRKPARTSLLKSGVAERSWSNCEELII